MDAGKRNHSLDLSESRPIYLSPGMGVRFTEIAEDVRDRIHELVKSIQNMGQAA